MQYRMHYTSAAVFPWLVIYIYQSFGGNAIPLFSVFSKWQEEVNQIWFMLVEEKCFNSTVVK